MLEVKVTITAPDLSEAIRTLAEALTGCQTAFPQAGREVSTPAQKAAPASAQTVSAPVQQAQTSAPAPQPVTAPQPPIQQPTAAPQPPIQQPTAAPQPAPQIPVQQAQATQAMPATAPAPAAITLDQLSTAGAKLLENGMMDQLMGLLGKYGVQALTQLKPEQYPAFAADLKSMGATI